MMSEKEFADASMKGTYQSTIPDFLSGGGEMGERIRNFDWSRTSLGTPENWEQSLKTCVRIMLSSRQPIWIGWGKDLIKLYNDPYKDIVRGKHPGALGQPASVVWKDIWKDIQPMLRQVMDKDIGTYVESQLLIMERSGYQEETYYTFSYTPVLGENGKPAGMICFNTDDTDRIISERQLKTLSELGKHISQCKYESDVLHLTCTILDQNQNDFPFVAIYKIERQTATRVEISGPSIEKVAPPTVDLTDPAKDKWRIGEAVQSRRLVIIDDFVKRFGELKVAMWNKSPASAIVIPVSLAGDGKTGIVLVVGLNPYRMLDSKYTSFLNLITDQLTSGVNTVHALEEERKRAAALQEIDKAKTIFFSNISHEFRTPLTLMLGPLEELLLTSQNMSPECIKNIETTHRNALRLLKLVNTLLDFSRIESGRQKGLFARTDIAAFTQNLAANFRSVIEKAGLQFVVDVEKIEQPVYVDREMWEKIVFNLLSNAFKFTLEGKIIVKLTSFNKQVILEITDTGAGIPEKELPHMFERFHRVENVRGRTYEGTGIGLSLVKELVSLHHGSISVQSKEKKGTTFTITIPTGRDQHPADPISERELPTADGLSHAYIDEAAKLMSVGETHATAAKDVEQPTVLVVDDNADMREYIYSLLSRQFNVVTASNGQEALEKIKEEKPTLLLSDVMMPVMDGIQLVKEIKSRQETSNLPVILLTARAGEGSRVEGYETGADDYLIKPFAAKELVARIKAQVLIAKRRDATEADLERKVRERTQQLEKSNRELESFNYIASHDLQEPLRKIQTFIHLMGERKDDPETVARYYDRIVATAKRMSQLIQSVLDYTRLSSDKQAFVPTNLNDVLDNVKSDFELVITSKGAIIESEVLPTISAVPPQMNQLFSNLISNALKFSSEKPVIRITTAVVEGKDVAPEANPRQQFLSLQFADNGIGFEQEYHEQIFKMFQRLHNKADYSGTGVGLSIVSKVAERHGGFVKAESQNGNGSVFTVYLPLERKI
jgi:signal transduction histidine kinase